MTSAKTAHDRTNTGKPGGNHPQTKLSHTFERNLGIPLDMGWVNSIRINTNAVQARANDYPTRRSLKKEHQAAWQLKAVTLIDLTTLSGDDTYERVKRLCAKAKNPINHELLKALDMQDKNITTGAVCVYHNHIKEAVDELRGTEIPVAAVSTGFPDGQSPYEIRIEEIKQSVAAGAKEIDIVLTREDVLKGDWETVYNMVKDYRDACGDAHIKVILGTGNLGSLENVAKASLVSMMAGADFIKTSTGKEALNANLPVSLVMMRMIRAYFEQTGYKIGYKPAGGISKAKDALTYLTMVKDELGDEWLSPHLFRFGASSLLGDIECQIEHFVTGKYSAAHRHGLA